MLTAYIKFEKDGLNIQQEKEMLKREIKIFLTSNLETIQFKPLPLRLDEK